VLPQADFDFSAGMVVRDRPSLTWQKDPATLRLRGRCDNYEAVRQAVEAIVNVERFRWQIYSPNFGMELDGLLGAEPGYAASELRRRLSDAFLPDSRILGIRDFTWSFSGVSLSASFTVRTVFGDVPSSVEVELR